MLRGANHNRDSVRCLEELPNGSLTTKQIVQARKICCVERIVMVQSIHGGRHRWNEIQIVQVHSNICTRLEGHAPMETQQNIHRCKCGVALSY